MATIFTISGTEKALILEPKESLIYPFDFGAWRELRIGAFMSITTSGFSGYYTGGLGGVGEVIVGGIGNQYKSTDSLQWGIMTSGKKNPSQNGCFFIGNGSVSGDMSANQFFSSSSSSFIGQATESGSNFNTIGSSIGVVSSGGKTLNYQAYSGDRSSLYFPTNIQSSGNNTSCLFNGMLFKYSPETNIIGVTSYGDYLGSAATTNASETGLRLKMDLLQHLSSGFLTGYCDSGSLPSALFLFSPFTGANIRIHSLSIKKYL